MKPFNQHADLGWSTETALLGVKIDILRAIDSRKCVSLVLLDSSAAFDTVTHDILLDRFESLFGITGNAQQCMQWIASCLEERSAIVHRSSIVSFNVAIFCIARCLYNKLTTI